MIQVFSPKLLLMTLDKNLPFIQFLYFGRHNEVIKIPISCCWWNITTSILKNCLQPTFNVNNGMIHIIKTFECFSCFFKDLISIFVKFNLNIVFKFTLIKHCSVPKSCKTCNDTFTTYICFVITLSKLVRPVNYYVRDFTVGFLVLAGTTKLNYDNDHYDNEQSYDNDKKISGHIKTVFFFINPQTKSYYSTNKFKKSPGLRFSINCHVHTPSCLYGSFFSWFFIDQQVRLKEVLSLQTVMYIYYMPPTPNKIWEDKD